MPRKFAAAVAALLSAGALWLCPYFFALEEPLRWTNSVLSIPGLLFAYFTYARLLNGGARGNGPALACGVMLAACFAAGRQILRCETLNLAEPKLYASVALYGLLIAAWMERLFAWLGKRERVAARPFRMRLPSLASLLLLGWIPMLLAQWPGGFLFDTVGELAQRESGYIGEFAPLHSLLVTLVMGGAADAAGSINVGISVYVILQMVLLSLCFAETIRSLARLGAGRGVCVAGCLYFALFPTVQMYAVCTVRDTLFSGCLTLTVALLLECLTAPGRFVRRLPLLGAMLMLTALLRFHSVWTPVVLLLLTLLVALRVDRSLRGRFLRWAVCSALICALGYVGLSVLLAPSARKQRESLSVPIQQLMRVESLRGDTLSADQTERLRAYFPKGFLYDPDIADPPKARFDEERYQQDKGAFWALWAELGRANPGVYSDAFLALNVRLWYPDSVMDAYCTPPAVIYEREKLYYATEWLDSPAELRPVSETLSRFYTRLATALSFERIPALSMLFSVGAQLWWLMLAIAYRRARRREALPLVCVLLYAALTLFCPVVLVRYELPLFFTFPISLACVVSPLVPANGSHGEIETK